MRTNLTLEDIKRYVEELYNGNLMEHLNNVAVPYVNENSEIIKTVDQYGNDLGEKDLAEFLNLHFFTWRNRLVNTAGGMVGKEEWRESLTGSLNEAYALVEVTDETATASQDIDSAQITGRVTIITQTNKLPVLDYYAKKIRESLLGVPTEITNSFGDKLTAYVNMGIILYDEEPTQTQLGETANVTFNFTINYISAINTYSDIEVKISVGADIASNYRKIRLTEMSMQAIATFSAKVFAKRPDFAGVVNSAMSQSISLQFFDFKDELSDVLDDFLYESGAIGLSTTENGTYSEPLLYELNYPIFMKIKHTYSDGSVRWYKYEFVLTKFLKNIKNSDFIVNTINLQSRALTQAGYEEVIE